MALDGVRTLYEMQRHAAILLEQIHAATAARREAEWIGFARGFLVGVCITLVLLLAASL